jgi:hypothetical protein
LRQRQSFGPIARGCRAGSLPSGNNRAHRREEMRIVKWFVQMTIETSGLRPQMIGGTRQA